jgi:hypothetical protein
MATRKDKKKVPVPYMAGGASVVDPAPFVQPEQAPTVICRLSPAKPTVVYDTYWKFACERQGVFFRRAKGCPAPWTEDPILKKYKFTNVYRASDRVSQYLINHVIYQGDPALDEVFFRIILFKFFNKIQTWQLLQSAIGSIRYATYDFDAYDRALSRAMDAGLSIFSAAYIMPCPATRGRTERKHRFLLRLLERMMEDDVPARLGESKSMRDTFDILKSYPLIGDFLAYQYAIDLNYSTITSFSEMQFVVPGPGCRDGIRKCFSTLGGLTEGDIIKLVCDRQEDEFARLGLDFAALWGRHLQLIDCQNLFCEVGKYARLAHPDVKGVSARTRIKQLYRVNPDAISYRYPPKWGINDAIEKWRGDKTHAQQLF